MIKFAILIIFELLTKVVLGQSSILINKTWGYKEVAVIYKNDTLILFHSDSVKNVYHLGKVNFTFKSNNIYNGTNLYGIAQSGNWSVPDAHTIVVDKDTNQILSMVNNQMILTSAMSYQDSTSNITGMLLTTLYLIPPITSLCQSLQSGDWTNSALWSCGHEPNITDTAVINPGHIITVSTNTIQVQRIIYYGGVIKILSSSSKIFIKGID